jgi:DNA invertase Pin-like site-specific DNA recombinase
MAQAILNHALVRFEMQERLRVVTYGRVNGRTPDHYRSLGVQMETLRREARRDGLYVVGEYADAAPGGLLDRPGLSRVLTGARDGEYDVLLISAVDRLGRSACLWWEILGELERAGVLVVCTADTSQPTVPRPPTDGAAPAPPFLDPSGPTGRIGVRVLAAVPEYERELARSRRRARRRLESDRCR